MIDRSDPDFQRDLAYFEQSRIKSLLPHIRRGLWHTTGPRGFAGIRAAGSILPNTGEFPFTFPQTGNSFGFHNGYVSLFDLGSAADEELIDCYWKWTEFFFTHEPYTIAIELDRDRLRERLIPNAVARTRGSTTVWIPWVEAWHDGPISLTAAKGFILIPKLAGEVVRAVALNDPLLAQIV